MKKSILFFIPNLGGGGAEKVLITILNNLNRNKYDISVLLTFYHGEYINQIPSDVQLKYIFRKPNKFITKIYYKTIRFISSKILYKLFVKGIYDIEVAFLEGEAVKVLSGSTNNSKKIAWVHTDLERFHWTEDYYKNFEEERAAFTKFNQVICVSNDVRKAFESVFSISGTSKVIYNPLDKNEIEIKSNKENVTFDKFTICSVGRLIDVKGYDRLISAHKRLIDNGFDHNLIILGEGNERDKLERKIRELGIVSSASLIGFKTNPYPYIKSSNLFVVSSITEGFPLVVAEALILQKAIVSTNCSGANEILENGKFGLVVDNSEDGIYSGIKEIIGNKSLIDKYSEMASKRINIFDIEVITREIDNLFDEK